jgi:WD40 repeat protein
MRVPKLCLAAFPLLLSALGSQAQSRKEMDPKLFEDWNTYYAGLEKMAEFKALDGAITAAAFASNGKQLFVAGENGAAVILEVSTGKQLKKVPGHKESILDACISRDGKYAATASTDDSVNVWDLSAGTEWRSPKHPADVKCVAFSPDGKKLATLSRSGKLVIWDWASAAAEKTLEEGAPVEGSAASPIASAALAYSKDGAKLARGNAADIKVYALADGAEKFSISGLGGGPFPVTISADGKLMLTPSGDGKLRIWDIQ